MIPFDRYATDIEMIQSETFVGGLAIVLAMAIASSAVGPWQFAYELRSIATIRERFGATVARGFLLVVAITLIACGVMILRGVRPRFANPMPASEPPTQILIR